MAAVVEFVFHKLACYLPACAARAEALADRNQSPGLANGFCYCLNIQRLESSYIDYLGIYAVLLGQNFGRFQ